MKTIQFKQTEIGKIPADWEVKRLGEICDVNPTTNEKIPNEFTYIDLESVVQGQLIKRNVIYRENAPSRAQRIVKTGDILYQTVRPYQKNNLLFCENGNFVASTGYALIRTKNDARFVYVQLHTDRFVNAVLDLCTGTSYPAINPKSLKTIQIPLPTDPAEQTRIAAALSDIDALLAALDKKIEKKKQIKQGAMHKLLSPPACAETADRQKGDEWAMKKLGEILDYEQPTKYIVRDTEYLEKGTPVLTAGKTFILGYTNENDNIFTNLPVIIFDDFTTATKFVDFPFKVKSSAMKMLSIKNKDYNLRLIFEIMQMIDFPLSDHQRYWISEFSKIEIYIPKSPEAQQKIAAILSDMDTEIAASEREREKYAQIKAGMMSELLTGKTRLI